MGKDERSDHDSAFEAEFERQLDKEFGPQPRGKYETIWTIIKIVLGIAIPIVVLSKFWIMASLD